MSVRCVHHPYRKVEDGIQEALSIVGPQAAEPVAVCGAHRSVRQHIACILPSFQSAAWPGLDSMVRLTISGPLKSRGQSAGGRGQRQVCTNVNGVQQHVAHPTPEMKQLDCIALQNCCAPCTMHSCGG